MKSKFLKICAALILISIFQLLSSSGFCAALPAGFEVYFNNPNGTQDLNAPGMDFRFKNYLDAASNTVIYAAFYEIDNSTAIAAMNSALNRGCTVYIISDADNYTSVTDSATFNVSIKTKYKKMTSLGNEVHNKFCVIKGSSVWTGSWDPTDNHVYKNNNNVVIIRSTAIAEHYEMEFSTMYWLEKFGSAKAAAINPQAWNSKTEVVNGVTVKINFSPYSLPVRTNTLILNELKGSSADSIDPPQTDIYFCMFTFTDDDIASALIGEHALGINVKGVLDNNSNSEYYVLRSSGVDAVMTVTNGSVADGGTGGGFLHHKFGVIDPSGAKARVITGSANWTPGGTGSASATASTENDENTVVIYSPAIAQLYKDEFLRLYKVVSASVTVSVTPTNAVDNVRVSPSPVTNNTAAIGFDLSSNVKSAVVKIYSLTGLPVKEIQVAGINSGRNEVAWDCTNKSSDRVASGIYFADVEASTPDGTFRKIKKFAVIKGKQ